MHYFYTMNAIVHIPQNELREAIDCCWYHEAGHMDQAWYSIPYLHQELILNLGDQFSITTASQAFDYGPQGGLSGLYSRPMITSVSGRYKALGIILKPFGLYRLFGVHAPLLHQQLLRLDDILGDKTQQLLLQLEDCAMPIEKIYTLERFILAHARPQPIPEAILEAGHSSSLERGHIRSLQDNHHISPKKYIQTFHNVVGYTPKKYVQLHIINAAIAQIAATPDKALTEIAYDNGFYDQAHFIRVFRSFAGMTPMAYKKAVVAGKVNDTFPNTIRL
ncbi:AraC family transcriptional regulator [Chitinophaga solisilvae]|uniref:AraC family transcriptional regulator n=1 Tax=Chitinophaga solisilvae TaxID=1233460 RepID=UPI00136E76E5|nr:helix-turn-helix domain-containing protein [Chitinophaga solisilvae]